MSYLCHRCHNSVAPDALYCATCGAPQLTVELPEAEAADEAGGVGISEAEADHSWATAVRIAGKLGVPAGVLGSVLSFGSLWVLIGSMYATVLYRQRMRTRVTRTVGTRMGAVLGLFAAVVATAADGIKLLVARYALHHGAAIDAELHLAIQSGVDRVLASNPSAMTDLPSFFHFWLSPDGRAALLVGSALLSGLFMVGFAALGGAIGARYLRPRQL